MTIFASGSEVNLAIETSHKLAKDKIYSKVVSVPCQDIFDLQSKSYKKKILDEAKFKISIEAASTDCWKKYIGTEGLAFGIDIAAHKSAISFNLPTYGVLAHGLDTIYPAQHRKIAAEMLANRSAWIWATCKVSISATRLFIIS